MIEIGLIVEKILVSLEISTPIGRLIILDTYYHRIQNLISSLPVPVPGNGQRTTDKSVYHYISN